MTLLMKREHAIAVLVGLARTGQLHARIPAALDAVHDMGEVTDPREDVPEAARVHITAGAIRADTYWTLGPDGRLLLLIAAAGTEDED